VSVRLDHDPTDLQQAVLRYLRREGEPRTAYQICQAIGRSASAALAHLSRAGMVEACGVGRGKAGWRAAA
jgi:hypothetical protein